MRLTRLYCVVILTLMATIGVAVAEESTVNGPWVAVAKILQNGKQSGAGGVYLRDGLIITAAHLTSLQAKTSVHIAGVALPAEVLKQGSFTDIDLSLLSIDQENLPAGAMLPRMEVCRAPAWPGDPVLVIDAERATRSVILSPKKVPFALQRYTSLIADVATTGNSGSGVFDPNRKCLLGIMSRKLVVGGKDVAKHFVPASEIRDFIAAALQPAK